MTIIPDDATEDEFEPEDRLDSDDRDPEAPAADAAEQAIPADPAETPATVRRGLEVDEYDALEQSRAANLDEER